MTTRFTKLTERRGEPLLRHTFGERADDDSYSAVTCELPGGQGEINLIGVIVGPLLTAMVEDGSTETVVLRETCVLRVPRDANELDLDILNRAFFHVPAYGDRRWAVQREGSQVGHVWNVYQLERKPLAQMDERRDAAVR